MKRRKRNIEPHPSRSVWEREAIQSNSLEHENVDGSADNFEHERPRKTVMQERAASERSQNNLGEEPGCENSETKTMPGRNTGPRDENIKWDRKHVTQGA